MKIKEFGTRGGGARPWRPPLDPPTICYGFSLKSRKNPVKFSPVKTAGARYDVKAFENITPNRVALNKNGSSFPLVNVSCHSEKSAEMS